MNQKLISRAQALAGKDVHNVASVIHAICMAESGIREIGDDPKLKEIIERNETRLRIFVATGKLGIDGQENQSGDCVS